MSVKIDRYGDDKMIVYCDWQAGQYCKEVHGARWNPQHKGWTYPLDWQICLEIRELVVNPSGQVLILTEAMKEWALAEKARQGAIPDLNSVDWVDVPGVELRNQKLFAAISGRPFQARSIAFGAATRRQLIAHDPGLGKTLQAIGIMEEADVRGMVLVVAPNSAVNISWPAELKRWGGENDYFDILGATVPRGERDSMIEDYIAFCDENPKARVWVLMNPYWIRCKAKLDQYGKYIKDENGLKQVEAEVPAIFSTEWSAIIADESHQTLACSTGNAKKWSQQRLGMGALPLAQDGILLSISGTPMRGKPENLYGQLNWLRPDIYTSYWKWIDRHFETFTGGGGVWGAEQTKEVGSLKDANAFYKEASNVMYRVTKEQVAKDLPAKMYGGEPLYADDENSLVGVWLPMEAKQAKAYKGILSEIGAELEDGHRINPIGILAQMTRLKQFAGSYMRVHHVDTEGEPFYAAELPSNKLNWISEFLYERDLLGKGAKGKNKVIIASQFTKLINLFAKELETAGTPVYVLTGETPMKERVRIVEEFQSNPDSAKVFLLNTKAGGTALTLDAADDVIICDETWIPDDQLQVEDRAHRLSRTDHTVTIWYLRSLGSIEERIGATTTERERVCKEILDQSRGLDIAKRLLGRK